MCEDELIISIEGQTERCDALYNTVSACVLNTGEGRVSHLGSQQ